jgi:nucleoside-diphosphate-sugar epimerase
MNKMNRIAGWQPQYTVKEGIAYAYRFDKEKRIR